MLKRFLATIRSLARRKPEQVPEWVIAKQYDLKTDHDEVCAFIQWKGTDVCMDFYCECGENNHFDGFFAYVVKCAKCGEEWEMPILVFPRKRCADTSTVHTAKLMEGDDDS